MGDYVCEIQDCSPPPEKPRHSMRRTKRWTDTQTHTEVSRISPKSAPGFTGGGQDSNGRYIFERKGGGDGKDCQWWKYVIYKIHVVPTPCLDRPLYCNKLRILLNDVWKMIMSIVSTFANVTFFSHGGWHLLTDHLDWIIFIIPATAGRNNATASDTCR